MLQHAASLFEAIGGVLKPVDLPMRVCGAIAGAEGVESSAIST
jgi:hypothetical protein